MLIHKILMFFLWVSILFIVEQVATIVNCMRLVKPYTPSKYTKAGWYITIPFIMTLIFCGF